MAHNIGEVIIVAKVEAQIDGAINEGLSRYYSIPNRELRDSLQGVVDDLSGKVELPEAHNFQELEQLLNSDEKSESSK